jgi:hypothetical protein
MEAMLIALEGIITAEGGDGNLVSDRGGGGGGGGRVFLTADDLFIDGAAAEAGLLPSSGLISVLGGSGSSNPNGGNPGDAGSILFVQTPEPTSVAIWLLIGVGAFGTARIWRRKANR